MDITEATQLEKVIDVEGITARLRQTRLDHIRFLLANKWTYERIGKLYGMSKQQVFAIVKRAGEEEMRE